MKTNKARRATKAFEEALATRTTGKHVLRLFVAGATVRSRQAVLRVRQLCEVELTGNCELEVIDIDSSFKELPPRLGRRAPRARPPPGVWNVRVPVAGIAARARARLPYSQTHLTSPRATSLASIRRRGHCPRGHLPRTVAAGRTSRRPYCVTGLTPPLRATACDGPLRRAFREPIEASVGRPAQRAVQGVDARGRVERRR